MNNRKKQLIISDHASYIQKLKMDAHETSLQSEKYKIDDDGDPELFIERGVKPRHIELER